MNEINIPFEEIMNMLKTYESTIKKEKPVLLVDPSTSAKKGSKSNKRKGKATKGNKKKKTKTTSSKKANQSE